MGQFAKVLLVATLLCLQGCVTVGFADAPVREQPCDKRLVGLWKGSMMTLRIDAQCVAHVSGEGPQPAARGKLHVGEWQTPSGSHALAWLRWGEVIEMARVVLSGRTPPAPELQQLDQFKRDIAPIRPDDFYLVSYRFDNGRLYLESANGTGFASAVSGSVVKGVPDKPAGATRSVRVTGQLPTQGPQLGNFRWFDNDEEGMERVGE